jgi:hypothetical protein
VVIVTRSHHKTRAHASRQGPRPDPALITETRNRLQAQLNEAKINRMTQAEIREQLLAKHNGEIPVRELYELRAMRLGGTA